MNLLYNLVVLVYYFVPIWAFLIWRFVKIKGVIGLLTIEMALLFATIWFAFNPMKLAKVTSWFHWYTFFLMAYILIFTLKFGYMHLEKVLALGLWMVFIGGEWWELSVFIYDGVGWLNGFHVWAVSWTQWLASHIHRAYVFVTVILMSKLARIRLNNKNVPLIFCGSFLTFVAMYPYSTYMPQNTLAHIIALSLFAFIVLLGDPQI